MGGGLSPGGGGFFGQGSGTRGSPPSTGNPGKLPRDPSGGKNFGGLMSHLILGENYFIFRNV